jgi:hypothetical protein
VAEVSAADPATCYVVPLDGLLSCVSDSADNGTPPPGAMGQPGFQVRAYDHPPMRVAMIVLGLVLILLGLGLAFTIFGMIALLLGIVCIGIGAIGLGRADLKQ